jgi:Ca2+-transporting ATPase
MNYKIESFTRETFIPFSSQTKYSVSVCHVNGVRYAAAVGAPDILASYANMPDDERAWAHAVIESQGKEGRRLVALSMCALEEHAQFDIAHTSFVGFMVIEDPVRPSVKEALVHAKEAGLKVIMITGDHPETAFSIGRELGIADDVKEMITGTALNQMSDAELQQRIHDIRIFARVIPEHKMRIVQALQSAQYVVAMMGDGVNDAPALKAADIGISVGTGTEVAKEASDMVLLENNFSRIIEAVFEGRVIFDNIRKVIIFLLITSLTEVFIIAGAVILGLPIPLSPIQLLWINLVTDSIPAFALGLEMGERAIWKEGPRAMGGKILGAHWYALFFVAGLANAALLLALYVRNLSEGVTVEVASTILFLSLAGIALFFIFSARVLRMSILNANPFRNRFIVGAVCVSAGLMLLPFMWPQTREIFGVVPLSALELSQIGSTIIIAVYVVDWLKVRIMKAERQGQ